MNLDAVPIKNPNAAYRIYDGQATVVIPDEAEVNVLSEVGSLVWERIDGKRTLREIVAWVLDAYDVPPETAERDILEFVDALHEHRMVS